MKPQEKQGHPLVALLTSPWSILAALGVSVFIGMLFKDVAAAIYPIGQMYLALIEMTVIPIIVSAVISSVAGLAKSTGVREFLLRMIIVFVLMLVGAAALGTLGGVIGSPGTGLDEQTRNTLGSIVNRGQSQYAPDLELSLSQPVERQKQETIVDFLVNMVPRNVFLALSNGSALELILFSIILGVAIGVLGPKYGDSLIGIFDGFFKAFQKIINWLMVALPFGLICLLADQIASTGFQILLAMLKFVIIFYAVGILALVLDVLIIWRRSHQRLGVVLKALIDPIVVSFVTRSSFAALPTAIRSLTQRLGFFERSTNLFFSLGVTIGRFGNIIYFGVAAIFVAQLYGTQLAFGQLAMVMLGTLFAGIATAGASGIATLNLLSLVLGPLGLPLEAVLILFIAIDTIADPLRTTLIIVTNMAANTLVVPTVDAANRRQEGGASRGHAPQRVDVDLFTAVKERKELVVALESRDAPPFWYAAEDGRLRGVSVELAERLAADLGVAVRYNRKAGSAAELVTVCREGEADLVAGGSDFSRVFESELAYTEPYVETREAILIDKTALARLRANAGDVFSGFRGMGGNVGVVRGSLHARTAARLFPKAAVVEHEGLSEMVDAFFAGSPAVIMGTEIELRWLLQKRPAQASLVACLALSNLPTDMRLGVATEHAGDRDALNAALRRARQLPWSEDIGEKGVAGTKA